jgi:hypothetical protein
MELFDYKPRLEKFQRPRNCPDSVRNGPAADRHDGHAGELSPGAVEVFKFAQHGQSGAWVSELLPHTAKVADELCFIKSMHTEAINHDPAITFFQTGAQIAGPAEHGRVGRYGLGSENEDPAGVRGDDLARQRRGRRPAAVRPAVGQRLSAVALSGREVPLRRRSGAVSVDPPASTARPPRDARRRWPSSTG